MVEEWRMQGPVMLRFSGSRVLHSRQLLDSARLVCFVFARPHHDLLLSHCAVGSAVPGPGSLAGVVMVFRSHHRVRPVALAASACCCLAPSPARAERAERCGRERNRLIDIINVGMVLVRLQSSMSTAVPLKGSWCGFVWVSHHS